VGGFVGDVDERPVWRCPALSMERPPELARLVQITVVDHPRCQVNPWIADVSRSKGLCRRRPAGLANRLTGTRLIDLNVRSLDELDTEQSTFHVTE
jgi:hypothetical protein